MRVLSGDVPVPATLHRRPDEHAVAATVVPPIDAVLLRYRLQLFDSPIQRIAIHGFEQFDGLVHGKIVLPVTSTVNGSLPLPALSLAFQSVSR